MHKAELQRQATMLIKQLSTEELSEAIDYLATIRIRKQSETPGQSVSLIAEGGATTGLETVLPVESNITNRTRENQPLDESMPESTEKNASAQRLIKAMQQPPYATPEDVESLIKIIKESRKSTREELYLDEIEELGEK